MNKQTKRKSQMRGKQGRKDSQSKRVNLDNERESKFEKTWGTKETKCSNDVRWYAHNDQLLRAAASIPFSQTTGSTLDFETNPGGEFNSVPGVLAMYFNPTIGGYDDDAIQAAKESIYSFVVHANSRNTSYNSTDMMITILSGMQVFCALASAIRAYGVMRTFDQRNRYLPKALVRAMGFDYDDLQSNLSNMWFDINEMIARSSQIWIPNTMPVLDRWFWLNSNVYMDSETIKGQYYLFIQDKFLGYGETASPTGGGLYWMKPDGTLLTSGTTWDAYRNSAVMYDKFKGYTWKQFKTMINGMFNVLLDSEDRGVIMGDILKAFGTDRIYALQPITSDYTVVPVYDREVLSQIENATTCSANYFSILQNPNTGRLYTNWGVVSNWSGVSFAPPSQTILNFHQLEAPTPEQIMVATRLKVLGDHPIFSDEGKLQQVIPETVGTEYINQIGILEFDENNELEVLSYRTFYKPSETPGNYALFTALAFDWAPWKYVVAAPVLNGDITTSTYVHNTVNIALGDYDMYTIVDKNTIKKTHTTAVYSEFGVPTVQ